MKQKKIAAKQLSKTFDSLPLLHNSLIITDKFLKKIDTSFFSVDELNAKIIFKKPIVTDSLVLTYRLLNFKFDSVYFHKNPSLQSPLHGFAINSFEYKPEEQSLKSALDLGSGLNYNGSYSRGLQFGNSQSLVTNSSFNLQMSGKIASDVTVTAAMTDNNIPIQPDGNTAQIQDFDKIYIKVQRRNTLLTAGDFDFQKPNSYFLNAQKKLEGLQVQSLDTFKNKSQNSITIAGAISKGKYARNIFQGTEGNQGPYRLTGTNGETFIIVLAGSEKVYINGQLLKRGAENDYTLDYNLGELIFTPNRLITKDARIQVEFQYSDKNYLRTTLFAADEFKINKWKFRLNLYNEADAANQPQQTLTTDEKKMLQSVGDSIQNALIGSSSSTAYDVNKILYRKIDTTLSGIKDSIFVFSVNKDSTLYNVSFSYFGAGLGDYEQLKIAANGRVYGWVGKHKGSYLPMVKIIAPNKQTVITAAADFQNDVQKFNVEAAVSEFDPNTLSSKNNSLHTGIALHFNDEQKWNVAKNIFAVKPQTQVGYEFVQNNFKPVENFRTIEFTRDWNLTNTKNYNQQIMNAGLQLNFKHNIGLQYTANALLMDSVYKGFKHNLKTTINQSSWNFSAGGSYLNFTNQKINGSYMRPEAHLSKFICKKKIKTGFNWNREWNQQKVNDTMTRNSFAFDNVDWFAQSNDSTKNKFALTASRRWDNAVVNHQFKQNAKADAASFSWQMNQLENQHLTLTASYRQLKIADTTITSQRSENTALGRINYQARILKGLIHFETLYELATVQEPKRQYTYLKVPDGTGHYAWHDLNSDGVQQLNEFTESDFQNNLSYERILIPTTQYVKANQALWNQTLNIEPANFFAEKYGSKKWMNRLVLQSNLQLTKKSLAAAGIKSYEPFSKINDSLQVSDLELFSTTLFINRNHPKWSMDAGYIDNTQKSLLQYGFETRTKKDWTLHTKLGLGSKFNNTNTFILGNKGNTAQYVFTQNYLLKYFLIEPKLNVYPNRNLRFSFAASLKNIVNTALQGGDSASVKKITAELKWNILNKSVLNFSTSIAQVTYNKATNTNVAYAILEGLQPGANYLWSVSLERKLAGNIEMSINYDGRKTGTSGKIIHTGKASLRALF